MGACVILILGSEIIQTGEFTTFMDIHQLEWVKTNGNVWDQLPKLDFVHDSWWIQKQWPWSAIIFGCRNDKGDAKPLVSE